MPLKVLRQRMRNVNKDNFPDCLSHTAVVIDMNIDNTEGTKKKRIKKRRPSMHSAPLNA